MRLVRNKFWRLVPSGPTSSGNHFDAIMEATLKGSAMKSEDTGTSSGSNFHKCMFWGSVLITRPMGTHEDPTKIELFCEPEIGCVMETLEDRVRVLLYKPMTNEWFAHDDLQIDPTMDWYWSQRSEAYDLREDAESATQPGAEQLQLALPVTPRGEEEIEENSNMASTTTMASNEHTPREIGLPLPLGEETAKLDPPKVFMPPPLEHLFGDNGSKEDRAVKGMGEGCRSSTTPRGESGPNVAPLEGGGTYYTKKGQTSASRKTYEDRSRRGGL